MDPENTAPVAVETPSSAADNISVAQLAARLGSRRRQASAPETATTPTPAAAPESELEGAAGGETPTDPEASTPVDQQAEDPHQADPTEQQPAASTIDEMIQQAIREAAMAPDKAQAVAKMAKRIKTVVDERDAERNQRLALQQQLTQGQPTEPAEQPTRAESAPTPTNDKIAEIDAKITTVRRALATIAANPNGYDVTNDKGEVTRSLSAEQLAQLQIDASVELGELSAEKKIIQRELQQQEEAQRAEASTTAIREYPWVNNREAPEYQLAVQELRQLGPVAAELRKSPAFALIVGRYIRGLQAERSAAAQSAATPAPARKPTHGRTPPAVVPGSASRGKVNTFAAQVQAAEAALKKSGGSPEAYARLRSLRRQAAAAAA